MYIYTLEAAIKMYENAEPRGEYVLVINGADKDAMEEEKKKEYLSISIEEHMDMYMKKGVDKKEAMKLVAKDRGVSKREIYSSLIK